MLALFVMSGAGAAGRAAAQPADVAAAATDTPQTLFSTPWDDVLAGPLPEWLTDTDRFTLGVGLNAPLSNPSRAATGSGGQGPANTNGSAQLLIKYLPISHWFVATTLYTYFRPSLQQSWDPDFTYVFGYDDWHPNTLSLVYANYGGNRFRPNRAEGERVTYFNQGTWSLGWKFALPEALRPVFVIDPEDTVGCVVAYNYTPRYTVADGGTRKGQQAGTLSCRYGFAEWWYVAATVFWYPRGDQQQPWNPDFTYSFGRYDWHSGTVSFQYSNYSGNRWPGRERAPNAGRFQDGSLGIAWSINF